MSRTRDAKCDAPRLELNEARRGSARTQAEPAGRSDRSRRSPQAAWTAGSEVSWKISRRRLVSSCGREIPAQVGCVGLRGRTGAAGLAGTARVLLTTRRLPIGLAREVLIGRSRTASAVVCDWLVRRDPRTLATALGNAGQPVDGQGHERQDQHQDSESPHSVFRRPQRVAPTHRTVARTSGTDNPTGRRESHLFQVRCI